MKKYIFIFFFIIISGDNLISQDLEGLKSINAKSKVQFVTPEALDQLSIAIRKYENEDFPGLDSILLDTYLSISSGYMINNHFRQAYDVYNRYLIRKENMLTSERAVETGNAINAFAEKSQKDEKEESELLSQVVQLRMDNENLESKRLSFKSNFSFAIIILSSIFALMIVSAGIRMLGIRSKLRQSHDRMKNIHRVALIGNFENGLRSSLKSNIEYFDNQTKEIQQELKKLEQNNSVVKQSNQVISGIEKIIREIKAKF